jgi:MoaA/NifB/PqqE/SkfB family radical SAM enzyme
MVHLRSLFQDKRMSEVEESCRKAFKRYGVSSILWNVTYQCDLKCWHCYVGNSKNAVDQLNTDQAQTLISKIGDMGIPLLFMTGGEPLLRKDIFK